MTRLSGLLKILDRTTTFRSQMRKFISFFQKSKLFFLSTKFDYNVILKNETEEAGPHQVICVYEGITCEQEDAQQGQTRILVQ